MNVASSKVTQSNAVPRLMRVSNKPKLVKEKVKANFVSGMSNRKNAKAVHVAQQTVARIINEPDVKEFVEGLRAKWYGLGEFALEAEKYQLVVKKDGHLGHKILEGMGVVPAKQTRVTVEAPQVLTEEEGAYRQANMIASVLIEGNSQFGVDLPDGVVEKMLESAEEEKKKSEK